MVAPHKLVGRVLRAVYPGHPGSCFVTFVRMARHAGRWPRLPPGEARPQTGSPFRSPALPFPYSRYRYRLKIAPPKLNRPTPRRPATVRPPVATATWADTGRPNLPPKPGQETQSPWTANVRRDRPPSRRSLGPARPPQPGRVCQPAKNRGGTHGRGALQPTADCRNTGDSNRAASRPHRSNGQSGPAPRIGHDVVPSVTTRFLVSKRRYVPHSPTSRFSPAGGQRSRRHAANHLHSHKAGVPYQPGSESRSFAPDRSHVR